ncbi:hypothetical protein KJ786_03610 [Patescibacteria group bacterium]|nr:hypothetical protein [Patescibacteria group bacterium]
MGIGWIIIWSIVAAYVLFAMFLYIKAWDSHEWFKNLVLCILWLPFAIYWVYTEIRDFDLDEADGYGS